MLKLTYKTSNLFSLKKYENSNLNCQSYEYPTIYGIRSAILGSIIQIDGIETAKELFNKIKNSIIYVQYPQEYKINNCRIKRYRNSYYGLKDEEKLDRSKLLKAEINFHTTMGFRQYVYLNEIGIYIDKSIPNIELYMKNIDWLGTAESMVYLHEIEEVDNMNDVLSLWNENIDGDVYTFEQYDWDKKIKFENVYMYSDKRRHIDKKMVCCIKDLEL